MLSSLDTHILVYAADEDAVEHPKASALMERALREPSRWMVAEQVLWEFYKALRNPRVVTRPLSAEQSARRIRFLREESGFLRCCYELNQWREVMQTLARPRTPFQRTHDVVLGVTLRAHGVERFYTRNTGDFQKVGFRELINQIDIK
jgi:predicted nucleic acid-binding protein